MPKQWPLKCNPVVLLGYIQHWLPGATSKLKEKGGVPVCGAPSVPDSDQVWEALGCALPSSASSRCLLGPWQEGRPLSLACTDTRGLALGGTLLEYTVPCRKRLVTPLSPSHRSPQGAGWDGPGQGSGQRMCLVQGPSAPPPAALQAGSGQGCPPAAEVDKGG